MDRLLSGLPLVAVPARFDVSRILDAVPTAVPSGHDGARRRHGRRSGRIGGKQIVGGSAAVAVVVVAALVAPRLTGGSSSTTAVASPAPAVSVSASPMPSASPSASPSPSATPKAKPSPSPSKHTAAAPAHIASGAKKGVGVWSFGGVSQALAASGASWYYTWSTQHSGITTPSSGSFVPMIWGAKSVTDSSLAQAREYGPYLLGFNEPDMAQQSNMTVEQALELWPKLMAAGKILGSPAVAYGGDTAGGWLDRFMSGAKAKGYRVDFITLHWYGGDFRTPQAVEQLKAYLAAVYARYHKPIWLTEYALIDFSQGTRFPSAQQQAAFVTASTKALDGLSYVQRYAWFGLGADPSKPSSGLFTDGTTTTAAGRAFQAAG
jgi:hypothetical protein